MFLYMTDNKHDDKSKFWGYNQVWHSLHVEFHKLRSHMSYSDPYYFTIYASLTIETQALKERRRYFFVELIIIKVIFSLSLATSLSILRL